MPSKVTDVVSLEIDTGVCHGDWRDDLFDNGFVVVKGVIEPQKAGEYVDKMISWLEKFQSGFNRHDPSTWKTENLPHHMK